MASVTITTTAAHDARLAPAFGEHLSLVDANGIRRNATTAEVKAHLIDYMRKVVRRYEEATATNSAVTTAIAGVIDITPT